MARLLVPAVGLMNRLRYPQKFLLISLLFAIPLGLMMALWLTQIGQQLGFARQERTGLRYANGLAQVFEPLQRTHGLAILAAAGDATARAQLAEEHARLEAAARDLDRLDEEVGGTLQVSDQWHALRSRLMHSSVEPGTLVTETRRLIAYVGDRSRMFLDPDLDSYYLIDAVLTQLPRLAERLSVEGAALVEQATTRRARLARPADVLAALGLAQSERDALDRGHAVAFGVNPGLRPTLEPSLGATWDAVEAMGSMVTRAVRNDAEPAPARPAREVYGLYERALGDLFAHHGAASAALDQVLQARVRRLSQHRTLLLALVASALVVVAYLWLGFYVAVRRAVTALDAVSRRMATGDFSGPVGVQSRDELRLVVDAFNDVAARLRTEWARAQEEAARARAAEASLARARDVAEAATRAKSEFLAVMSHEIRTPMNGVLGMAHLLLDTRLDPRQRQLGETLRGSADALLEILNDILDLSKMEAGRFELEQADFDLDGVVGGVVTLMLPRATAKGLSLTADVGVDVPRALRGDSARLRQVLLNLVGNAIKFTDEGGVRITVECADAAAVVSLRVTVNDSGIGIAPEVQPRLFEEFAQADVSVARRFGGTGLGLAISKRIVTAMGGEIGLVSTPGEGSTFWFTVVLAPAAGEPTTARREVRVRPLRILVAEDNTVNQDVARGLLERRGHRVDVVGDGAAAVRAVTRTLYDVVLMDVHMPGVDGIEAARQIRQLAGEKGRVPIIALSASAMRAETDACLAAGMNDHLPKPIDPLALAAALARHSGHVSIGAEPAAAATPERAPILVDKAYLDLLVESLGATKVQELLLAFEEHARPHRDQLARAGGDPGAARAAAHALHGMAANLGLAGVADAAAALEEACAGGSVDTASLCAEVEACVETTLRHLREVSAVGLETD